MNRILLAAAVFAALPIARPVSSHAESLDQAALELREHHRHHHYGGITQFIAMSLDTIGVDEAKRPQIEKLQQDLHACMASAAKAEQDMLKTLADGVATGSVDGKKVDGHIERLGTLAADTHRCGAESLNKLHEILSPVERQALVDKVQAHWQVWRQVNHEAEVGGKEPGGRLAELGKELSLTSDQLEKISAQLHKAAPEAGKFEPKKAEDHFQAFADAFTKEAFDAQSIATNANGDLATHGARRMAHFYKTVAPLLTPEQRATLAAHLREHAGQLPS